MPDLDTNIWRQLHTEQLALGELDARRVAPALDIYAAIGHDGFRRLLLGVPSEQEWFRDERSRGISVRGRNLSVEGQVPRPFLDVTCTDRNGHEAFDLVAAEILGRLVDGTRPEKAVSLTLDRWRRFWSNALNGALSDEAIRGLFGELWFLSMWLFPRGLDQIHHWVGPAGTRHDFQWPDKAIEVKATLSTRGHIHHINGFDQLEPPESGPLFVFSLQMRSEPGSSNSLVSLIGRVRSQLVGDAVALNLLETRLAEAGYSPAHDSHYDQFRFRVVEERLYRVESDFPRINTRSFAGGVPAGIEGITYTINLGAFGHLCVAQRPSDSWQR